MTELMRADWYRARKGGAAALVVAGTALCAALFVIGPVLGLYYDYISPSIPAMFIFFAGFAAAVLCGITEERDASEGALRNKVVTGHTRAQAYWSMYLVNTLVAVVCAAVFLGIIWLASLSIPVGDPDGLPVRIAYGFAALPAFTALYSLIGVIWMRRGTGIICVVVFIALCVFSLWDFVSYMDVEADTAQAAVLGFLNSFLPTGQGFQIVLRLCTSYLPLYSLGFCAVCWCISLAVVKRRNLQ